MVERLGSCRARGAGDEVEVEEEGTVVAAVALAEASEALEASEA